jgi:glycosyltransferase involved in cell wall biosynthesis
MVENKIKRPKVSVIMPVYNTELYVREALTSILNQTLTDIEVIVVNDGSTDNSLAVINELAATDGRVQVYSQENQGQSVARNTALDRAIGWYIYFMDSDDLLESTALKECYEKCERENLNFVTFDADIFTENGEDFRDFNYLRCGDIPNRVYTGIEILEILLNKYSYRASPCLHFINASFLNRIGLSFYPGIIHEDELYMAQLYLQAERVGLIPKTIFKRRIRENSIMTREFSSHNILSYMTIVDELLFFTQQSSKTVKKIVDKLISYIINPAIYNSRLLPFKARMKILKKLIRKYLKYVNNKTLVTLIFPYTVKIKSICKNKWDR